MIRTEARSDLRRAFLILALLSFTSGFVSGVIVGIGGIIVSFVSGAFWLLLAMAADNDAKRTARELGELKAQLSELQKKGS
jgi:hypothetical protein